MSSWQAAPVVFASALNATSAFPRVARSLFTPNLQHVKRNWRQRVHGQWNATRRSTQAGTCRDTYLCGSCVHVWARPDKGTVVDSTHLLHICKEPDPAFCKRNINKAHEERCSVRKASFQILQQCRSFKSIHQSAYVHFKYRKYLQIGDKLLWCWLIVFIGFFFFPGSVLCHLSTSDGWSEIEFISFYQHIVCRF